MDPQRIKAVLLQEFFHTLRSMEVFMDLFFFPMTNVLIFGFLSLYLSGDNKSLAGQYVLLGMLLWDIIWIIEYSISVGSLWNIWARNLSNMFIAPLRLREYFFAHMLSGIAKAAIILLISYFLSLYVFHFDMLSMGIPSFLLVFLNFALFAFAIGMVMLGLIFRYGTRIQAFSWGIVPIFQPLSAAFYPLEIMPLPLQYTAYLFPPTFSFEAARFSLLHEGAIHWQLFSISLVENIVYCILSLFFFNYMFYKSRDSGQFARNEA